MSEINIVKCNFFHQLCALPYIEKIILFGSRYRGDHKPRSDIDLAYFSVNPPPHFRGEIFDIINDNKDTLLKIDLVHFDELGDQKFKEEIINNHMVLYEREG